ncbi:integral membrane regulator [Streptomyces ipomoeae]|uniref:Integral membrane regulator n=2 Tax=Streptomyces ipomoeae TaxID=103232 RepID=A0AAE8VTS2_9ACTN|nr:Pr6Pr family membrane protein [Streptomyces ipomoeae]EKX68517.1 putative membrane protein [Streptomyces ipomoeae 91-03]TQE16820.1 integral membrane regulator [Streptomyces ipomoeae]TQE36836.1 integral membrane regulator [Streptomyces ipomoeae]
MTAPIPKDIPDLPAISGMPAPAPSVVPATAVVTPVRRPPTAAFRALVALAAAMAVVIEMALGSPLRAISHFSVQSTAVVALVFVASSRRAWSARRPLPPLVTGGTVLYTVVAALVYHLILAKDPTTFAMTMTPTGAPVTPTGWHAVTDVAFHTAIPLAVVADWLLLTRPSQLRLIHAAAWLLYPMTYLAFTLGRAALLTPDWPAPYLYPFLDADRHGYKSALGNALLMGLAIYALALFLVAVDHLRPDPVRPRRGRRDRHDHRPENRISSPAAGGLK